MPYVTDGITYRDIWLGESTAGKQETRYMIRRVRGAEAGVRTGYRSHQIPVLFGGGLQLFEVLPSLARQVELFEI